MRAHPCWSVSPTHGIRRIIDLEEKPIDDEWLLRSSAAAFHVRFAVMYTYINTSRLLIDSSSVQTLSHSPLFLFTMHASTAPSTTFSTGIEAKTPKTTQEVHGAPPADSARPQGPVNSTYHVLEANP